jgi:hypothetical protein
MNERNLNEDQWEDRKEWSLGDGQRRKAFWNWDIYSFEWLRRLLREGTNSFCFIKWCRCVAGAVFYLQGNWLLVIIHHVPFPYNIFASTCLTSLSGSPSRSVMSILSAATSDLSTNRFRSNPFSPLFQHRTAFDQCRLNYVQQQLSAQIGIR